MQTLIFTFHKMIENENVNQQDHLIFFLFFCFLQRARLSLSPSLSVCITLNGGRMSPAGVINLDHIRR